VGVPILLVLFILAIGAAVAVAAFFLTPDKGRSNFAALRNAGTSFIATVTLGLLVVGFLWAAHVFDPQPTGHPTPAPLGTRPGVVPGQITSPSN
jgi:H+/Cl- antiporter ClcA